MKASKKKYHDLDEVGFVGLLEERSIAQIKKDAKRTSDFIKTLKSSAKKRSAQAKKKLPHTKNARARTLRNK